MSSKPRGYFQKLLIMDSETTGLEFNSIDPSQSTNGNYYQAVSWGLVVLDVTTMKVVDKLYVEIKWDGKSLWSTKAETVHGLSKDYLAKNGLSEVDAIETILNFIFDHFGVDEVVPCGGHNVSTFDIFFMRRLLNKHGVMFKTGNRFVDTNSIGLACFGTYNSDDLFDQFGIVRDNHNSLEDALACAKVITITRKLMNKALE